MGANYVMVRNSNIHKIAYAFFVFALVYLLLDIGFHIKWKSALDACREAQIAQGEHVESEVFGNPLGAIFDITYWLVYSWATIYHFGTPFATPCIHSEAQTFKSPFSMPVSLISVFPV